MSDYRYTQIEELEQKIEETRALLEDPSMAELAREEITKLESEKQSLEDGIRESVEKRADNLDERNILVEVKGAAGGDEAKLWAEELLRMYTRFAQRQGYTVEQLEENVIKLSGKPGAFGA
ncbi:MAG TPA: PCRF domain-containing protein, partial [Patescibacteria group bacterium]|nr:PCRF domain-containing protein [Patescibacteria group bacterium]